MNGRVYNQEIGIHQAKKGYSNFDKKFPPEKIEEKVTNWGWERNFGLEAD